MCKTWDRNAHKVTAGVKTSPSSWANQALLVVEGVFDLFFAKNVRKGQARCLQDGRENEPKSLWEKSSSLIK